MAGSHVIVKSNNEELPDSTFEEAGRLAATTPADVPLLRWKIDYIQKKHVKKPKRLKTRFCGILHQLFSYDRTGYFRAYFGRRLNTI